MMLTFWLWLFGVFVFIGVMLQKSGYLDGEAKKPSEKSIIVGALIWPIALAIAIGAFFAEWANRTTGRRDDA